MPLVKEGGSGVRSPFQGQWTEGQAARLVGPDGQALGEGGGHRSPAGALGSQPAGLGLSDQWETLTSSGNVRTTPDSWGWWWERKPVQTSFLEVLSDCFSMCV